MRRAKSALNLRYARVEEDIEREYLRVYDAESPEEIVKHLHDNSVTVSELFTERIGLEEYYINLMEGRK